MNNRKLEFYIKTCERCQKDFKSKTKFRTICKDCKLPTRTKKLEASK